MELEQRVKALEYEIKILKNEIQRTLLEIHEQVLVHYYPTLRTADSTPVEGAIAAIQAPRVKPVPNPADDVPVVRKVSLEEVKVVGSEAPPVVQVLPPVKMGNLLQWGLNAAAQIGVQPTSRIVELFASKGILDSNACEILLQVAPLNRRAPPEEVAITDILRVVFKLDELLNHQTDIEETLALIKEANLG